MNVILYYTSSFNMPLILEYLNESYKNITSYKMDSQFSKMVFFSTLLVFFLSLATMTETKSVKQCKDDWDCEYGNYCHFKKKVCRKSQPQCVLSAQTITCMLITGESSLIRGFEPLACDVVTEDPKKQKICEAVFKQVETSAKLACDISLAQICCPQKCPENFGSEPCKKFGRNYKC